LCKQCEEEEDADDGSDEECDDDDDVEEHIEQPRNVRPASVCPGPNDAAAVTSNGTPDEQFGTRKRFVAVACTVVCCASVVLRPTQPSVLSRLVNRNLSERRQRKIWFILFVDKHTGEQLKP